MALVTIQRSPSPSTDPELDGVDSTEDASEGKSQLRKRSKTAKEKLRKIFSTVRFISKLRPCLSESYFTVKGAALILPHNEFTKKTSKKSHGGEIQSHLQTMLHLLRPEDTIKIAVRLEDVNNWSRYMALVSTRGRQDTEEAVILGIDCTASEASIGLVLPIWMGLTIKLGGDGGFSLCTDEQRYLFKPVSVQAMWSAIQSLVKVMHTAEEMKYIHDGLTHTWVGYYKSHIDRRDATRTIPWNVEGVEVFAPSSLSLKTDDEDKLIKLSISQKLKEVMMTVDLDEATSVMLRKKVEEGMGMSLIEFKSYFDEEVMRILGQMDEPSKILDYLYLGSEWNASNLDELNSKGIGYILNVTREIDNFFMGMFQYYNVRVLDVEEEELLRHWDKTYKFIAKARDHNSKVLVHCKMGVSRSASTVMAYLMKEKRWTVTEAYDFVKEKRGCVNPNPGFMEQLSTYQGILTASNQRDIFKSKSNQNLLEENPTENAEIGQGSFLGASLFTMMSHPDWPLTSGGAALKEEWYSVNLLTPDFSADRELEAAESRSADSIEDSVPDAQAPYEISLDVPDMSSSHLLSGVASFSKLSSDCQISPDSEMLDSGLSGSQASLSQHSGLLGARIKPDSSWIKLDAEDSTIENIDKDTIDIDSSSKPDMDSQTIISCYNTQGTVLPSHLGATNTDSSAPPSGHFISIVDTSSQSIGHHSPLTCKRQLANPSPSKLTAKEEAKFEHAKFSIGDTQICTESAASVAYFTSNCTANVSALPPAAAFKDHPPAVKVANPPVPLGVALSPEISISRDVDAVISSSSDAEQKDGASVSGKGDNLGTEKKTSKIPLSGIEMGVRQYFLKEKIPWNIGKVKKMREDINKTGQILQELEINKEDQRFPAEEFAEYKAKELIDDDNLLDRAARHHHPTLSQSHSCMELSSMTDMDQGNISLYQREEIPLEPGTVRRTKQEIEDRQRFFSGDGDEDVYYSTRPVQRSSSLKHEGETRLRVRNYRRLTHSPALSPIWGKSLNDLTFIEVSDLSSFSAASNVKESKKQEAHDVPPARREAVANVTLHMLGDEATPIKSGLVRRQKLELESKCEPDKGQNRLLSSPEMTITGVIPGFTSPEMFQVTNDLGRGFPKDDQVKPIEEVPLAKCNLDPKTLALIREIGSALLMSPTSGTVLKKDEEPCTNKVKYLVKRIENKTNTAPQFDSPVFDSDSKKIDDKLHGQSCKDIVTGRTLLTPDSDGSGSDCWLKLPSSGVSVTPSKNIYKQECRSSNNRSSQSLQEDKHNIVPSTLEFCRPDAVTFASGIPLACISASSPQSNMSNSPHSPCQFPLGDISSEPSVVRHLVGKFETQIPDTDQALDFHSGPSSMCLSEPSSSIASESPAFSSLDKWPQTTFMAEDRYKPFSSSLDAPYSPSLASPSTYTGTGCLPKRQASLDSATYLPAQNTKKLNASSFDINVELYETTEAVMRQPSICSNKAGRFSGSSAFDKPAPTPFSKSNLESSELKSWRPVRPLSAECPSADLESSPSCDRSKGRRSLGCEELQPNEEGRKIRRLHGKSHPLTKLSEQPLGKGPFYSSM